MNIKNSKWDQDKSKRETHFNNQSVKKLNLKLQNYNYDMNIFKRQENQICKYCSYVNNDRMAFQAFTNTNCSICDKEIIFATSNIDKVCPECAKENNICKHCGAEMD